VAWAFRLPPLLRSPFHPDEALYGYWGLLVARGRDPWLTTVPVDKPPLLPYAVAGLQLLFGEARVAVRLPGLMAGLLTVPLSSALAKALYRDRWTAVATAVGVSLSPLAIQLSGSGFPDVVMVAFGAGACVAATRDRMGLAGLLAGLSFATKQTGLVWLPLLLLLRLASLRDPILTLRSRLLAAGGWLLIAGLVFVWNGARVARGGDSFWQAGVVGYGGLRLIWPHELWGRLEAWSGAVGRLFGSSVVNGLLLVGLPVLIGVRATRWAGARRGFADILLVSFSFVYLLVHWLAAFPIWDRYLLPLVPSLAVLLGRIVRRAAAWPGLTTCSCRSAAGGVLLAVLLAVPAFDASAGRCPIGRERAAYDGIDDVVSFLRQLPEGSVVYHHWLGWHYHHALFDAPVYLAYWPTPGWLARDVQAFGGQEPRYVAFPAWESTGRVEAALRDAGYKLEPMPTTADRNGGRSFTVYRVSAL
jgi:4-amino-4-deoxy-L-arabinose transferase-like glycosyltransferase